jgi:tRNA(adenine34) deaminase
MSILQPFDDQYFMEQAIQQAKLAVEEGEVPVGAVITCDGRIIARAHNQTEQLLDVTAHAEILAITAASNALGSKYLNDCKLYVTLEPCVMCAGALAWSQIGEIIFAAEDEKRGFMRVGKHLLHPTTKVRFGLLQEKSATLLKSFFAELRS